MHTTYFPTDTKSIHLYDKTLMYIVNSLRGPKTLLHSKYSITFLYGIVQVHDFMKHLQITKVCLTTAPYLLTFFLVGIYSHLHLPVSAWPTAV